MLFYKKTFFHITDFTGWDVSIGIHLCWAGRLDIHFLRWMISIGNIPLYKDRSGHIFAASNSYHTRQSKMFRAGVPR